MKITKSQLKQVIKEEFEKMASADVRAQRAGDLKQKVASGVTDQERGIVQKLQAQLAQAAKIGNIASGKVLRLAQLLSAELLKTEPEQPPQQKQ